MDSSGNHLYRFFTPIIYLIGCACSGYRNARSAMDWWSVNRLFCHKTSYVSIFSHLNVFLLRGSANVAEAQMEYFISAPFCPLHIKSITNGAFGKLLVSFLNYGIFERNTYSYMRQTERDRASVCIFELNTLLDSSSSMHQVNEWNPFANIINAFHVVHVIWL